MNFSIDIILIYWAFLGTGIIFFVLSLYVFLNIKHHVAHLQSLLEIFEQSSYELDTFLKVLPEFIAKRTRASGVKIFWGIGDDKEEFFYGHKAFFTIAKDIKLGDLSLTIETYRYLPVFSEERAYAELFITLSMIMIGVSYHIEKRAMDEKIKAIDRMSVSYLHDLKNICQFLRVLEGNIEIIKGKEGLNLLPKISEGLNTAIERMERLIEIIAIKKEEYSQNTGGEEGADSLNSISEKPSQGEAIRQIEAIEYIGLKETIDKVCNLLAGAQERVENLVPIGIKVKIDKKLLETILENIIKNSLDKVVDKEDLRVQIRSSYMDERFEIIIEDNGPPIKEGIKRNIFKPFFTTKNGGSGIGLFQVKQNIEKVGGNIEIFNRTSPQEGVVCKIRLPLRLVTGGEGHEY